MKITIHFDGSDDLEPLCRLTAALEDEGHAVTWEHDGRVYEASRHVAISNSPPIDFNISRNRA